MNLVKEIIFFLFLLTFLAIPRCEAQEEQNYFLHTVEAGQSLYAISNMYNVSIADIEKLNPGCDVTLYLGQLLRIPQSKSKDVSSQFHTIKAGETLYRLSTLYKVSVQDICNANPGLNADNFRTGQVIRIPVIKEAKTQVSTDGVQTTVPTTTVSQKPVQPSKFKEMHKVKKKETVYSICKKYGITEEELLASNPTLQSTGLQKGDLLYIPYPQPKAEMPKVPSDREIFEKIQAATSPIDNIKMAILLPFEQDNRMVEYYQGVLMAVDSLKRMGASMEIYAFDTSNGLSHLLNEKKELTTMDIIIGPQEKSNIKPLAEFAKKHRIRLVIPFTSKDNEVFANPYIYMVNTPQMYLYPAVYDHFLKQFKHANVIFIENSIGDKSKDEFITGMKNSLLQNGVTYSSISDGASMEEFTDALFSQRENIFIPTSGSHVALLKFITKLELLARHNRSSNISLFGYPEWQTMTKEHIKQFFAINTYFYTAFYTNDILPEARQFEHNYRGWYHKMMEVRYPRYGMLGFDTSFFFLKGLHEYGGHLENNVNKLQVRPVQSGLLFKRVNNWGGFINQKVFFVHYTSSSEVSKIDFD